MIEVLFERKTQSGSEFVPLFFDSVPEESYRANASATENEVEEGAAVVDHVRPERRSLTLRAVVSDTPIAPTPDLGGSMQSTALERRGGPPVMATVYTPAAAPTRVADSWRILMDARAGSWPAIVTTKLETFTSMALIECETTRTARDGTWLVVQLTFAEIRTVETQEVEARVPARVRDRPPSDDGSREAQPVTSERIVSALAAGTDAVMERVASGRGLFR